MKLLKNIFWGLLVTAMTLGTVWASGEALLRLRPELLRSASAPYLLDRGDNFYRFDASVNAHSRVDSKKEPLRIAVIGDSFAYGVGVEPYDNFAFRMRRWLNNNTGNRPVQVDLLPRPGWSTYRQLELLDKALADGADLVLLAMCLNDTEDWERPRELLDQLAAMVPGPPDNPLLARMVKRSHLLLWLHLKLEGRRARPLFMEYYERLYSPTYSGWRKFDDAASAFARRCRERGVQLMVVVFPLLSHDLRSGRYPFDFCHRAIETVWRREGVPVLNLYEAYRDMRPERLQALPGIDPHPSEIAHRIAARTIIRFIDDERLLPPGYYRPGMFNDIFHRNWQLRMLRFDDAPVEG